jgi:capsular polysaccharide export protein
VAGDPRIAGIACLVGIAPWKRKRLRAIFRNAHGPVFRSGADAAIRAAKRRGGAIAGWASRMPDGMAAAAAEAGVPLWWIEDGFIRSVGLGAALVQPASLTVDSRCQHCDPSRPSDLEVMLQTGDFPPEMLVRAEGLIAGLRRSGVTKYNLGGDGVDLPEGRRIVLVPGQVEDDRSVVLGGAGVAGMADLLARVRAAEPDAYILFKPHPDVVSGLRTGALDAREALKFADAVVAGADLAPLLERVDAVHVLTSLAGFEALIREREVVVHGQPFYAGWGLTRDLAPVERRTRRRSLAELVAAALIAYPLYVDPRTARPCTPEALIDHLAGQVPDRARSPLRAIAARFAAWHAARRMRRQAEGK